MYTYYYKNKEYSTLEQLKRHSDFKNVSFPVESLLTDEMLAKWGITRKKKTTHGTPLSVIKALKVSEIERDWNVDDEKPILVQGIGEFDITVISRDRIRSAKDSLIEGQTRKWTLTNGETVQVSKSQLQKVLDAWLSRCDEYHAKYMELKVQVADATTREEVERIGWRS